MKELGSGQMHVLASENTKDLLHLHVLILKGIFKLFYKPLQLKHFPSAPMIIFGSGHLHFIYTSDHIIVSGQPHLLESLSSVKPVAFPNVEQLTHLLEILAKPTSQ